MESDPIQELAVKNEKYVKACTELYLSNKNIGVLGKFERFTNLEILWLGQNHLTAIDNLDFCFRMKELHLANNKIKWVLV